MLGIFSPKENFPAYQIASDWLLMILEYNFFQFPCNVNQVLCNIDWPDNTYSYM